MRDEISQADIMTALLQAVLNYGQKAMAVMEATKNTGILNSKTADVLADGKITVEEAKVL